MSSTHASGESSGEPACAPTSEALGFGAFFREKLVRLIADDPTLDDVWPARVVIEYQDRYQLLGERGGVTAQLSGITRQEAMEDRLRRPAVGDWVAVRSGEDGAHTIVHLFDRRTRFVRQLAGRRTGAQVVAANIDAVFVVTSCNRDCNARRIERYLAIIADSGARPVIVLNKVDLCDDAGPYRDELERAAPGVPVIAVSASERRGHDELFGELHPGETVVLVGSSGVGKSTLINWLCGRDVQAIGDIRDSDSKGRHTTTHRELIVLPGGSILIDTPGMRELQIFSAGEGVSDTFAEIAALAASCRFRDCNHENEPGCAVREAVEAGELDPARLGSFAKLRSEKAHAERRQDASALISERKRGKRGARAMRAHKKLVDK